MISSRFASATLAIGIAVLTGCSGSSGPAPVTVASQDAAKTTGTRSPKVFCDPTTGDCTPPPPRSTPPPPPAVNPGCTQATIPNCALTIGDNTYSIVPHGTLELTNYSGTYIQVNYIQGTEIGTSTFGEYCASLGTSSNDQTAPDFGQVGCGIKDSGPSYPPIVWNDSVEPTALQVAPGQTVSVHPNDKANGNNTMNYEVNAAPQTWGVQSWRQPRVDAPTPCNGAQQSTVWNPWQNTTGAPLYLRGAEIYATSGTTPSSQVVSASMYILDTSGNVRWSYSSGSNGSMAQRGTVSVPPNPQIVQPGEYIAAQAINTCPAVAGATWDWAAFLYVSTG